MQNIKPYTSVKNAVTALNNGGRFYNLFTRKDDNVISPAELKKAAGTFSAKADAFLFFEMALADLAETDRARLVSMLSPDLKKDYAKHKAAALAPSVVESIGKEGKLAIVSGYSRFVENKSQFNGMAMIPLMAGKVMTFMMIPLVDKFDVYEVFDTPDGTIPKTVISTLRGGARLKDGVHTRFGGMLKKLTFEDKTQKRHGLYLDTLYYTPLA